MYLESFAKANRSSFRRGPRGWNELIFSTLWQCLIDEKAIESEPCLLFYRQNSVSKILYICKYINALPRLIILLFFSLHIPFITVNSQKRKRKILNQIMLMDSSRKSYTLGSKAALITVTFIFFLITFLSLKPGK